jgi:hypothetical protein
MANQVQDALDAKLLPRIREIVANLHMTPRIQPFEMPRFEQQRSSFCRAEQKRDIPLQMGSAGCLQSTPQGTTESLLSQQGKNMSSRFW